VLSAYHSLCRQRRSEGLLLNICTPVSRPTAFGPNKTLVNPKAGAVHGANEIAEQSSRAKPAVTLQQAKMPTHPYRAVM